VGKALVAALVFVISALPALGGDEGGSGPSSVSGFLSGKLPPIREPADDPVRIGEEPGPDTAFFPWVDWSAGQTIVPMRRIALEFYIGSIQPAANLAASHVDYSRAFEAGPWPGIEVGYIFAPFLTVSFSYCGTSLSGKTVQMNMGGTDYDVDFGNWPVNGVFLTGRFKFPLTLIGPQLFRFSHARVSNGFVPYLRLSLGGMSLAALSVERSRISDGLTDEVRFYDNKKAFGAVFGMGLQVRWSWGGIGLELNYLVTQRPAPAIHFAEGAQSFQATQFLFSMGFYF